MIAAFGLLSLICVIAVGETKNRVVDAEPDTTAADPVGGLSPA
jgi:hypothetical protein